jgi:RimJ/RimL family protein N-acetyltransferase
MIGPKGKNPVTPTASITFRLLQEKDLPMMHRWLNTPHISQWWSLGGSHHPTLAEVENKYTPRITKNENVDCYLIIYEGKPIGMIQSYNLDNEPEEKENFGVEGRCTGIDLFIGEEDHVHRGLGSSIIRGFLKDIVFLDPTVEWAVIDPYTDNKTAIRAYEKAGFKYQRTVWYETDKAYENIMTLGRGEITD